MNRGKFVILTMLVVAIGMSSFAWWHRWSRSLQVRWGADVSALVRRSEQALLLRLGAGDGPNGTETRETLSIGNRQYSILESVDIAQVAGLIHARHHLTHEKGFLWDAPAMDEPNWTVALRFRHADQAVTFALDFQNNRARLIERDLEASMEPIAPALQRFLEELRPPDSVDPKPSP